MMVGGMLIVYGVVYLILKEQKINVLWNSPQPIPAT